VGAKNRDVWQRGFREIAEFPLGHCTFGLFVDKGSDSHEIFSAAYVAGPVYSPHYVQFLAHYRWYWSSLELDEHSLFARVYPLLQSIVVGSPPWPSLGGLNVVARLPLTASVPIGGMRHTPTCW